MSSFKYSLQEIQQIGLDGFEYSIPTTLIEMLMLFSKDIGHDYNSPINPIFNSSNVFKQSTQIPHISTGNVKQSFNKKRKNKEVSEEEWNSFQTTKIEQRIGIDANIDKIKLSLNKISDKTFLQMRENIINELDFIYSQFGVSEEDNNKLCNIIYNLVSTNKFYSRIFVDLYSELIQKYPSIRASFNDKISFDNVMNNYRNIQYTSPDENYDLFCDNNKKNELRKSLTTFYVNLSQNGIIEKSFVAKILKQLLSIIMEKINTHNCKNEVDELTENVAILFNKEMLEDYEDDDEYMINDKNLVEVIEELSQAKSKNYLSLSNKAIFKFMDIMEV
jgi:hypothetical protein